MLQICEHHILEKKMGKKSCPKEKKNCIIHTSMEEGKI